MPGWEWNRVTRLYYYRARYYDPKIGRFISEDPIGFGGGVNFYAYVGNGPINRRDPSGLLITVSPHYTPQAQAEVALLNVLQQTERGRQLIDPIMNDPNRNLTVGPDGLNNLRYDPVIVLGHELGHAAAVPNLCQMYDEQRNVNFNENLIRGELGFPRRTTYP